MTQAIHPDPVENTHQTDTSARDKSGEAGFTLVEMLVVLGIIVLIAGIAGPQVLRYLGSARSETATTQIANINSALELFYIDNMRYPTTEEGLAVLAQPTAELAPRWNGPYLKNADGLVDPWGNPYVFTNTDGTIEVISLGRDASPGGTGENRDLSSR